MFVAEMLGNCTLTSWIPNSQITHAVADRPEGPFAFKETLFDTFHHNPRLTRDPETGDYLLFMIGGNVDGTAPGCEGLPDAVGETYVTRILVSKSASLNGEGWQSQYCTHHLL